MKRLNRLNSTAAQREQQREAVKDAVRKWLDQQEPGYTISTRELSILLSPDDPFVAVQILTSVAKQLAQEGLVRRGEPYRNKYGKYIRPNVWGACVPNDYGITKEVETTLSEPLDADCLPATPSKKNSAQIVAEWKERNAAKRRQ